MPKAPRHVPSKASLAKMIKDIGRFNYFGSNPVLTKLREAEDIAVKEHCEFFEKINNSPEAKRINRNICSARDRRRQYETKLNNSMFSDKKKLHRMLELEGPTPEVVRLVKKFVAKYDPIIEE